MKIGKNADFQTVLTGNKAKILNGENETSKDRVILCERENDNFLTMGKQLQDMKSSSFASKFDFNEDSAMGTALGGITGAGMGFILGSMVSTGGGPVAAIFFGAMGGAIVGGTTGLVISNMVLDGTI